MNESFIKLIAFDLDDTIFPEYDFIMSGFDAVSKVMSKDFDIEQKEIASLLKSFFDHSSKNVFDKVLNYYNIEIFNENIEKYVKIFREHEPRIIPYPDVIKSLVKLKKTYKLALITDGYAISQRNKIKVLGINELFDEIIVTDEHGKSFWKPYPGSFEMLSEKTKVDCSSMAYVGDNPCKDFNIKKTHAVLTIHMQRKGFTIKKECDAPVHADLVVDNMEQLIDLLEKR